MFVCVIFYMSQTYIYINARILCICRPPKYFNNNVLSADSSIHVLAFSMHAGMGLPPVEYGQVITMIYLKVAPRPGPLPSSCVWCVCSVCAHTLCACVVCVCTYDTYVCVHTYIFNSLKEDV